MRKEEVKILLFLDDMMKDPKESIGIQVQLINILSKVSEYKISSFPVHNDTHTEK